MERLWAPWRIEYIEKCDKIEGCIFCVLPAEGKDRENLILHRGEKSFVIMNNYPYNPGHLMIASFKHTADMHELSDDELLEINHLLRNTVRLLRTVLEPHGFNIGVNLGRTAGAGVLDHIHWHIVPRWNGDTNFMPVISDTRVLPQSLSSMYDKLSAKMEEPGAGLND